MNFELDTEHLKYIAYYEERSDAAIRDCFTYNERLVFVVEPGDIGKAIGKGGRTVKQIQEDLNTKIKLVEYTDDPTEFIVEFLKPIQVKHVKKDGDNLIIHLQHNRDKSRVIGRGGENLERITKIIKRYHDFNAVDVA